MKSLIRNAQAVRKTLLTFKLDYPSRFFNQEQEALRALPAW